MLLADGKTESRCDHQDFESLHWTRRFSMEEKMKALIQLFKKKFENEVRERICIKFISKCIDCFPVWLSAVLCSASGYSSNQLFTSISSKWIPTSIWAYQFFGFSEENTFRIFTIIHHSRNMTENITKYLQNITVITHWHHCINILLTLVSERNYCK